MLVFIDESGDPGFKIAKGSTPLFVVSMVIFESNEEAERTSAAIKAARASLRVKEEFKFSRSHPNVKDGFFEVVAPFNFQVRSLVVMKEHIYSANLRTNTSRFYNYFVQALMAYDNDVLQDARIKIDGSGDRRFKIEMGAYLRRELGSGKIKDIKFAKSHKNNLIQLADMSVGAVARAFHPKVKKDAGRWLQALRDSGKIQDIWKFE